MVHLGLVPDSPGSENPTASFSSGSAVPLSYIIYLPDWTLICRSVLAHPPTDREREKKVLECACVLEAKPRRRDFLLILHRDFSSGLVPCIFRKGTDQRKRSIMYKVVHTPHPLLLHTTGICQGSVSRICKNFFYLFISEALLQFLFSISFSHICNHFALSLRYSCLCRIIFPFVQISHSWGTFASDRIDNDFLKNYIFLFCSDSYFK